MKMRIQFNFSEIRNKLIFILILNCHLYSSYSQTNIEVLSQKGNLGDSLAQFELGMIYLYGNKETPRDLRKAILWLEKSPVNKNSFVQYQIGKIYYDGLYGRSNYNLALLWFKKSADQDNPKANYSIAQMYNLGEGVDYDVKMACKYFKKGAKLNDTLSIFWLGICYETGSGIPENKKEAFNLFNKAASLVLVDAQFKLAEMYEYGVNEVLERNCNVAIEKFILCANSGHRISQFHLGELYSTGKCGISINYEIALTWFEKCLENKNGLDLEPSAAFEAGKLYFFGKGVKQDRDRGATLIKIAVDATHIEATKFWEENEVQKYFKVK